MTIDIDNRQTLAYDESIIIKVMERAVLREGDTALSERGEVSVSLVNNAEIRELNLEYRLIDAPTDVLSFPMDGYVLGDIVISMEKAVEQAQEYGHGIERELGFLAAHGMLHLLGYDHEDEKEECEMFGAQEEILEAVGLGRKNGYKG